MDLVIDIERNGKKIPYVTVAGRIKAAVDVNARATAAYRLDTCLERVGEDLYAVAEYEGLSAAGAPCRTKGRARVMAGGYGPNKTNPVEVAETSAIGRALGFAGYGIDTGVASAEEIQAVDAVNTIQNGTVQEQEKKQTKPRSEELHDYIRGVGRKIGLTAGQIGQVMAHVDNGIAKLTGTDIDRADDVQTRIISSQLKDILKEAVEAVKSAEAA